MPYIKAFEALSNDRGVIPKQVWFGNELAGTSFKLTMSNLLPVAIIQSAPVFLDLGASVTKALILAEKAARGGARVIAFGETWLPGYPAWLDYCRDAALWDHAPAKEVFARLRQNSVVIPGTETLRLAEFAGDHKTTLVIGVNERVESGPGNGTLYNSLLIFNSEGELANHHRKLVPTYTERLIWGQGDGNGLKSVATSNARVGGLICWEHWMPLTRQVLHNASEDIHVAVWPTVHEMHQLASQHYAFEGRCFVLATGLLMRVSDLPSCLSPSKEVSTDPHDFLLRGGSAIIGPDGQYIVGPVYDRERSITAELDLDAVDREKMTLDVSGHYSRPDIFDLRIRQS